MRTIAVGSAKKAIVIPIVKPSVLCIALREGCAILVSGGGLSSSDSEVQSLPGCTFVLRR